MTAFKIVKSKWSPCTTLKPMFIIFGVLAKFLNEKMAFFFKSNVFLFLPKQRHFLAKIFSKL
jgi:hypothetical protein